MYPLMIWAILFASSQVLGFQLYKNEPLRLLPTVDPKKREFTYYITDTYMDFQSKQQKPITSLHEKMVAHGFKILEDQGGIKDLRFIYGGTYAYEEMVEEYEKTSSARYDQAIYIDFTSHILKYTKGVPAGRAYPKSSPSSGKYVAGGYMLINSDWLDYLHPNVLLFNTISHEAMHILGVGHSTVSSSLMAYTENWQNEISSDDRLALANIFQDSSRQAITVTATLEAEKAAGIELAFIDTTSGRSYVVLTNSDGIGEISGIPNGSYYLGARELTPTGPCFLNPTQGFLTSFYLSDTTSTNIPDQASVIEFEGKALSLSLPLIKGKKAFDCHYADVLWESCGSVDRCFRHLVVKNQDLELAIKTDITTTHHHTDTDLESGSHASIQVQSIGSEPSILFTATDLEHPLWGPAIVSSATIAADANLGTYAGLCVSKGQYALMSSVIEVGKRPRMMMNKLLHPEETNQMPKEEDPRNMNEYDEKLGVEEKAEPPKTTLGVACGESQSKQSTFLVWLMLIVPILISRRTTL